MRKERKHYTSEEKVAILRRQLLDQVPVSKYPFRVAGEVDNFRMADNSPETVRPTCRKRSCWLSKESNACYGPKPRFMSQSG